MARIEIEIPDNLRAELERLVAAGAFPTIEEAARETLQNALEADPLAHWTSEDFERAWRSAEQSGDAAELDWDAHLLKLKAQHQARTAK